MTQQINNLMDFFTDMDDEGQLRQVQHIRWVKYVQKPAVIKRKKKAATKKASTKKRVTKNKTDKLIASLSPEQAAALAKQLKDKL